jgi:hypothetical protein
MNEVAARRPNRWTLPAMVLVFAAPVLAAWFFYFNPEYLPSTRSNKGELIQPLVVLADTADVRAMDGGPFDLEQLKGVWTLISLNAAPCDEECRQRAIGLRQIRLALGETRFSVARLLLLDGPADTSALADELEGMHIAMLGSGEAKKLLAALGEGEQALNRTYILDPMGNLMMRYPADAPPKDTLKDMERLLKASKNWIKGASYGHR